VWSIPKPTGRRRRLANKVILGELRKKLEQLKGLWAEEIPDILWGYHYTPQSAMNGTPYRLTYGIDSMISVELGETSWRRANFDNQSNNDNLKAELDLVQEVCVMKARVRMEVVRNRVARRYNTKVWQRSFQRGDLVWRKFGDARRNKQDGKLAPNWDGPFRIVQTYNNGAYKIEELGGKLLPRTWNATHLKMYYS